MSSTQLIVLIISLNVATCFNQLHGHPQATHVYKIKITIANLIFSCGGDKQQLQQQQQQQ